jgi:hypothetical protein
MDFELSRISQQSRHGFFKCQDRDSRSRSGRDKSRPQGLEKLQKEKLQQSIYRMFVRHVLKGIVIEF